MRRAVSAFDLPQRFVMTHTFETTQASGLQTPLLRQSVKNWQFDGMFQAQSGMPVTLLAGTRLGLADTSLLGGAGNVRPNVNGAVNVQFVPDPGAGENNPNQVIGSGLTAPLVGGLGTLGRNTMRLNPFIQADWMA